MYTVSNDEWFKCGNYFSKSRCNSYKFCPMQYKKTYIDKTYKPVSTEAMVTGLRFHEFAETFMQVCHKYDTSLWQSFIHPDHTEHEQKMINWFIDEEISRYESNPDYFVPLSIEHKVINHDYKIRGIVDRIDQINEDTLMIIEYKTGKSLNKQSLQFEFGFYKLLLENNDDFNYDLQFKVINPNLQQSVSYNPSRQSTILNLIDKINNDTEFKPRCTSSYRVDCQICTDEELLILNNTNQLTYQY